MADVANEYFCIHCGGSATKKPLTALRDWKSSDPTAFGGLGTWRCAAKCRKGKVKVTRRRVNNGSND